MGRRVPEPKIIHPSSSPELTEYELEYGVVTYLYKPTRTSKPEWRHATPEGVLSCTMPLRMFQASAEAYAVMVKKARQLRTTGVVSRPTYI